MDNSYNQYYCGYVLESSEFPKYIPEDINEKDLEEYLEELENVGW